MANLKYKYSLFGLFFVLTSIALSGYPIWVVAMWLAEYLGVPENVPVKEQENGLLWGFLFIIEAVSIFVAIYIILGKTYSIFVGWSKEVYSNIFWKSIYPFHWQKNIMAITSTHITEHNKPILLVSHYLEDHSWAFLSGQPITTEEMQLVTVEQIIKIDPAVLKAATLQPGWSAKRNSISDTWVEYRDNEI